MAASFGAELLAHRSALLRQFPRDVFDAHQRRFSQLEHLARRLNNAVVSLPPGHAPLHFPDSGIWFPDVHNGTISARLILFGIDRSRPRLLQLGASSVSSEDEQLLNPILDGWARDCGEAIPYVSIQNGVLVNERERTTADFRAQASDNVVITGFYSWESFGRWMMRRGELQLVMGSSRLSLLLAAPMSALRKSHPDWQTLDIRVTLLDENTASTFPLGTIRIKDDGVHEYQIDASVFTKRLGNARRVRLVMDSREVWRPAEIFPGSRDERELTVQVFRVGFSS
jgi:hypothetical protein